MIDEDIDLERVVIDAEYRARVLRYLNECSVPLSPRNIDLARVIADVEYRREAVHLLNGVKDGLAECGLGGEVSMSWHLPRNSERTLSKNEAPKNCNPWTAAW